MLPIKHMGFEYKQIIGGDRSNGFWFIKTNSFCFGKWSLDENINDGLSHLGILIAWYESVRTQDMGHGCVTSHSWHV